MAPIEMPPAPRRRFASDNNSGAHPDVMAALAAANDGHALAYGEDPWTDRATESFRRLFDADVEVFFVWGGTGANVMALATMTSMGDAVVCTSSSHIDADETGAPENIVGCKLIDVECPDGKLRPAQLEALAHLRGDQHHAQPAVLSITQSSELGTLYTPAEVTDLCATARSMGMTVHLDGARIANATAALGGDAAALREFTVGAGVDVVSFGGTKNGMTHGEAVVYIDTSLAKRAAFVRKAVTQLPSKMRFVAAQFEALLAGDLWLRLGAHANEMAGLLHSLVVDVPGVKLDGPPAVNSLYPLLARDHITALQEWSFFYDWDPAAGQVRWMTAWDTEAADVEAFAAGVRAICR